MLLVPDKKEEGERVFAVVAPKLWDNKTIHVRAALEDFQDPIEDPFLGTLI